ncbi:MAG: DNA repair protein RecO [Patescibacteria group bacterium]
MIRFVKTEGVIIKRRNFGELDRILTVLTKTNGKIQVRAPGVRKITSRRSPHIELLNLSILTLYRSSRSLFPIVTEAESLEEFLPIKNNLHKVGFAYYTCELVDKFCPDSEENKKVFYLLKDTLYRLVTDYNSHSIIENFEEEFLVMLGFLPKLHKLKDTEAFIEDILERKLTTRRLLPLFLSHSKC